MWDTVRPMRAMLLTAVIAFAWTVPWDNYLVYRGVWGYGPDRVVGTVGYVPVEEYLFFLLQPFFVGAFVVPAVMRRSAVSTLPVPTVRRVRIVGSAVFGGLALVGMTLLVLDNARGLYMGLILAWALPVLAGLWIYAGPHLWRMRRALGGVLLGLTLWLWMADRFAIGNGIWFIADAWSFGIEVAGLPVEEMTFFLVTNLLCAFSIVLFLHGDRIQPPWRRG